MANRISSLDTGYESGDLSFFPDALDDRHNLYFVKNNSETFLRQTLTINGKKIIVDSTETFPDDGILRVGPPAGEAGNAELIYYGSKSGTIFSDLIRGFAGSRQTQWTSGAYVTGGVMAEHHNAIKDAVLKIEDRIGTKDNPSSTSINGILKELETRFLAPKALFRGFPLKGKPNLNVRFQNMSDCDAIRFLWDFGDGTTSLEKSPNHIYRAEGIYTVRLDVITSTGAQSHYVKSNYINISEKNVVPFFYVTRKDTSSPSYSRETAEGLSTDPATMLFIDQTEGDIVQRFWVFDDGETLTVDDPDSHVAEHIYQSPGEYNPTLVSVFSDQTIKRVFLSEKIIIL